MNDMSVTESFDMAINGVEETPSVEDVTDENANNAEVDAADEQASRDRKVTRRGLGFCSAEDFLVCRSWVQAKKDFPAIKREALMDEMLVIYDNLRNQNAETNKSPVTLPSRTSASIFQRFRKVIAPSIAKMHSIMEINPQESGEDDHLHWDRLVKVYATQESHQFVFRDCYEFLLPTPEFQQYNKKLGARIFAAKRESEVSEFSVASIQSSLNKKVKVEPPTASSVNSIFSSVPAVATIAVTASGATNHNANSSPARLYSSRGGKSGSFSSRGASHVVVHRAARVIPPTGNVFQDELLRLFSELVDATHACMSSLAIERSEDDEAKKNYANAVLKSESLRVQEEALLAERRVGALIQSKDYTIAKNSEDMDVEQRIGLQEQFWLGDEKKGSMKDRLETLEMFVHSETSDCGFHNRLLALERQAGIPIQSKEV